MFQYFWKKLSPKQLSLFIQTFSLVAIFFEGYDQGPSLAHQIYAPVTNQFCRCYGRRQRLAQLCG